MGLFFGYIFWIIIDILALVFCKLCFHRYDYNEVFYKDHYKPFKMKIWILILYLIACLLPIWNIFTWIILIVIARMDCDYKLKDNIKDLFLNNWITKFLNKEV